MADEKAKEQEQQKPQRRGQPSSAATSIIRVAGKDVNGSLSVERAIDGVKGIGTNLAHNLAILIARKLNIPKDTPISSLSEQQIADLENLIKNPIAVGLPEYMVNRNKDSETGMTMEVVSNDLLFGTRQDINRDIIMKAWRGYRHQYGQRVRGQHARSTGRTGATVGVTKKAIGEAEKAVKAPSGGRAGPAPAAGAAPAGAAPAAAPAAAAAPKAEPKKEEQKK